MVLARLVNVRATAEYSEDDRKRFNLKSQTRRRTPWALTEGFREMK